MRAASTAAAATPTSDCACATAAWLSSYTCRLTASIFTSSALRRALVWAVFSVARALDSCAWALASATS